MDGVLLDVFTKKIHCCDYNEIIHLHLNLNLNV